jgi:hypothetical protein
MLFSLTIFLTPHSFSASSHIIRPSQIHYKRQSFLSGLNAIIDNCAFIDCFSASAPTRGGAVCVVLPSSRDTAVLSTSFENCRSSGDGGACFLDVVHVELFRVCASRCSSTFGQFVYFAANTEPQLSSVTLFQTPDQGNQFGGVYFDHNRQCRLTGVNFTGIAVGAHGAAFCNIRSADCECIYLTVCECRGVTVVWTAGPIGIRRSNFFRNAGASAVIWLADRGLTVEQCVFMGNSEVEIDAVDGPVIVADCVFDNKIPRVVSERNNIVIGLIVSLDLAGENVDGRHLERGGRWAGAHAAENSARSPVATTVTEADVSVEDGELEEIVGIVFMCLMLCCLILPPLYVILKYRKRLERITHG